MSRTVVVLRPAPSDAATANRLRAAGLSVRQLPFFAAAPVAWTAPAPTAFDALLVTSANAVRHGGPGLEALKGLPVVAVGAATAAAARAAGFMIAKTGESDAAAAVALAREAGFARLLHLAGQDRAPTGEGVTAVTVYASDPAPVGEADVRALSGCVVLLHSTRAAQMLAARVFETERAAIALVALSPAVGAAAGEGWESVDIAAEPSDDALVPLAATRAIDRASAGGDKHAMTDYVPTQQPRGARLGTILICIALAFAAGLALMGYAMHRGWLGGGTPAATVVEKPATSTGYVPQQPLNANGEAPAATAALDPAMLATREAALAGQLAALEARTAAVTIDASAASGQATRAEGLLVAFAARRAIDRGLPLGYLEEQLRLRFGATQPRATFAVIQAARQPVTIEDLRKGLDDIAPEITAATGDTWGATLRRQIDQLIVLRRSDTPSPMAADRLARARRLLEGGQVEAARAEVARLPGARDAGNWMAAATRYIQARHALDGIENAAILGQVGQPNPAPVAAAAPTVEPVVETPASATPVR
ncbi:uroporphyrinogen-III synthase [Sphingomonas ginsenosidivorax]|uniref:uroporphyrinogen-III synthase n=1 Tax=Sphingomonas ginsenosidivorax TaxID=862135 RepID=UPI001F54CD83|nr:uroporphyrinogen-III synthase [Sphingomonas ginsenosidivorax]